MATPPLLLDEPHGDASGGDGGWNKQPVLDTTPAVKTRRLKTN